MTNTCKPSQKHLACFVSKGMDQNCALVKFPRLQCGAWIGLWTDLGLKILFTVCSRNMGKRRIMTSTKMIAVIEWEEVRET